MSTIETSKLSAPELAQLRAEMRRRKILERGDERMRKLFKESKDETAGLSRSESVEERNKNLIEELIKDPKVKERINSVDNETQNSNLILNGSATLNSIINQATANMSNDLRSLIDFKELKNIMDSKDVNEPKDQVDQEPTKPKIDFSYFEKQSEKERLREERLAISRSELLLISLLNILTLKRDVIVVSVFKILFACLASYFCFNIVTPFIISQSIAYFYSDFLSNRQFSDQFSFKLSYCFIKSNLLDSLNFVFFYIIMQTFV